MCWEYKTKRGEREMSDLFRETQENLKEGLEELQKERAEKVTEMKEWLQKRNEALKEAKDCQSEFDYLKDNDLVEIDKEIDAMEKSLINFRPSKNLEYKKSRVVRKAKPRQVSKR